jgi:predicted methyltransferase
VAIACGGGNPPSVPPGGFIPYAPAGTSNGSGDEDTAPVKPRASATASSTAQVPKGPVPLTDDAIQAIVNAADRTDDDKKMDANRHPAEFLKFLGIGPGMNVGELGAGGGYTTELLARAVAPSGKVYAQNSPDWVKKFLDKPWSARLARPADKNVVREDQAFETPFPDAQNLDLAVFFLIYHDTVNAKVDRDKMNASVFAALKHGGAYVVVDASAKAGDGIGDTSTLHRIDEAFVKTEVMKAGFTFAKSADFLRNKDDKRDWNSAPNKAGDKKGTEDRFILEFTRPL